MVEEQQMLAAEKILNSLSTWLTPDQTLTPVRGRINSREFEERRELEGGIPLNSLPDWLQTARHLVHFRATGTN